MPLDHISGYENPYEDCQRLTLFIKLGSVGTTAANTIQEDLCKRSIKRGSIENQVINYLYHRVEKRKWIMYVCFCLGVMEVAEVVMEFKEVVLEAMEVVMELSEMATGVRLVVAKVTEVVVEVMEVVTGYESCYGDYRGSYESCGNCYRGCGGCYRGYGSS